MSDPLFLAPAAALAAGAGTLVTVDGAEGRHAVSVRRLAPGETLLLADGSGGVARALVREVAGRDRLVVELLSFEQRPAPDPRLIVVQALPKADRGQLAVELMTEVGVDAIVPWAASRCVARWEGAKAEAGRAKWQATAREATKQARRVWLPEIAPLASTQGVAAILRGAACALVLHEGPGGASIGGVELPSAGRIVLVVGPEGGITGDELALFAAAGGTQVVLGPSVMRTSTAGAVAAGAILSRTPRWA